MQRSLIKRKRIKTIKKNKTMISRSKTFNINYSAKIIDITSFRPHSNLEVNKLKCFKFLDKESKLLDKGESDIESES